MAIESIASVKSHFETGDRPTQAEFTNLIDTLGRATPLAIASAAEGGKTGLIEMLGDGDVTARSLGAFGRNFITAAATASAHNALGISSVAAIFVAQETTASAQQAIGINAFGTIIVDAATTASATGHLGGGTAGVQVFSAVTTASAVSSLGITNHVVQQVRTQTGAVATGTTQIPADDSIPLITEGNEYMTLAITPTNADNFLLLEAVVHLAHSAATTLTAALFQDTTVSALAVAAGGGTNDNVFVISLSHRMTAATVSETTFRIRGGGASAGQTTFNGLKGSRILGGALASSVTITEITR